MEIIQQLAASGNHGGTRRAEQIKYLVIHYTGNDGDKAAGNAAYFQRTVVKASAHYFVDDNHIYQSVPDLTVAWAVGGKRYANASATGGGTMFRKITNTNSISIELCDSVRDGNYQASEATLRNAATLAKSLMAKYGISSDHVYRHFDVTGKHCPSYMIAAKPWAAFKARLEEKPMDNTPAAYAEKSVAWALKTGIMTGNKDGDLMLSQPITRQQFVTMLHRYAQLSSKA